MNKKIQLAVFAFALAFTVVPESHAGIKQWFCKVGCFWALIFCDDGTAILESTRDMNEDEIRDYSDRVSAGQAVCNEKYYGCKIKCEELEIEIDNPYASYGSWSDFWHNYSIYTWSSDSLGTWGNGDQLAP